MRVTQIVAPGAYGGLEQVISQLATGLARRGAGVTAALLVQAGHAAPPDLVEALSTGGVRVRTVASPHRGYLRQRRLVGELLGSERPDVAHTHGYLADVLLRSVAQSLQIPTVATAHGFTGGDLKNRIFERFQRHSFRRMDAVVAVSRPLGEALTASGIPASRVHLIRNAWAAPGAFLAPAEARARLGIDPGARVVGWVGRLSAEKAPDLAVSAIAASAAEVTLSLLGDGPAGVGVRELSARLGVQDRIRWHGAVAAAWQYFRAFDVFCLSSRTEGTPIALLEAMAAGVPVVATHVGGVPDVVTEAEAILVPPDDPRALAAAIAQALNEDQRARTAAARHRLEAEFGVVDWIRKHESLYLDLTSSKAVR